MGHERALTRSGQISQTYSCGKIAATLSWHFTIGLETSAKKSFAAWCVWQHGAPWPRIYEQPPNHPPPRLLGPPRRAPKTRKWPVAHFTGCTPHPMILWQRSQGPNAIRRMRISVQHKKLWRLSSGTKACNACRQAVPLVEVLVFAAGLQCQRLCHIFEAR